MKFGNSVISNWSSMKYWQTSPSGEPNQWQKERGYNPSGIKQNPKARFHANGKYATGKYKEWLDKYNVK